MKVNVFFEIRMNKSEIKLLFRLLIWDLCTVDDIHFHEICV